MRGEFNQLIELIIKYIIIKELNTCQRPDDTRRCPLWKDQSSQVGVSLTSEVYRILGDID